MKKTIESLFEHLPDMIDSPVTEDLRPQSREAGKNYDAILQLLGSDGAPLMSHFLDWQFAVSCEKETQSFVAGFRLGAQLMLEVLEE